MKILKNEFGIEWDSWDDPGDYPCGAGGSPLPSYNYICDIPGELVIELEPSDEIDPEKDDMGELANEHADLPSGVRVSDWAWSVSGNKVTLSVQDFDASGHTPPERDYDDYD
jgi:hypothetical protein